jgi:spore germination protein YaaH
VLFTVSTTDPSVVDALTASPATTSARLATQLGALVAADHLDGVDIDIEGRATKDRAGFVTFVSDLSKALRAADPAGEIVLDTYPQSAGSPSDFFDVAKLAPFVDALFVMAYDMNDFSVSSASSPLASPSLGLSDVSSLLQYTKIVPAAKLVLGLPLYGNDYATAGRSPGSAALASSPIEVTYASIVATGRTALWDPGSLTPYEVFERSGVVHQTWFDDPISLALKAALADTFQLGGVGAWALGQEGSATEVLEALDGGTAPLKLSIPSASG